MKTLMKLVVCDEVPQRSRYELIQTSFSFKQRQDKQNWRCYLALEFPLHLLYVYFCWCHGGPRFSVERRIELTLEIWLQEHINDIQARKFDVLRCSGNFDKASALAWRTCTSRWLRRVMRWGMAGLIAVRNSATITWMTFGVKRLIPLLFDIKNWYITLLWEFWQHIHPHLNNRPLSIPKKGAALLNGGRNWLQKCG